MGNGTDEVESVVLARPVRIVAVTWNAAVSPQTAGATWIYTAILQPSAPTSTNPNAISVLYLGGYGASSRAHSQYQQLTDIVVGARTTLAVDTDSSNVASARYSCIVLTEDL